MHDLSRVDSLPGESEVLVPQSSDDLGQDAMLPAESGSRSELLPPSPSVSGERSIAESEAGSSEESEAGSSEEPEVTRSEEFESVDSEESASLHSEDFASASSDNGASS